MGEATTPRRQFDKQFKLDAVRLMWAILPVKNLDLLHCLIRKIVLHINKRFFLSILFLCNTVSLTAQTNPVYRAIQHNRNALTEHPIPQFSRLDSADYLRLMGYDSIAIANLEAIDVILPELGRRHGYTEKDKAVRSDCIIIGTVAKVEHFRNPEGHFVDFRTTAYVEVEEYLRNDFNVPKGLLPIKFETGPGVNVVGEETLKPGEHVLLFLSATFLMEWTKRYAKEYYQKAINEPTIQFQIIGFNGKYTVNSGRIYNRHIRDSRYLEEVKMEIKTVVNAIKKGR